MGRARFSKDLRQLIRDMAAGNPTWGEERIANELKLKLGIRVSPRTVGKYLCAVGPVRTFDPKQRWLTIVHNHAKVIAACDFSVVVTATFGRLYVRRDGSGHPQNPPSQCGRASDGEMEHQQFREALPGGHTYDSSFTTATAFSLRNWTSR
jgi:hypothetical protein